MDMIYEDVKELVGHTPLLRLKHLENNPHVRLYAKLELLNPGGSVKDRIGLFMIEKARQEGLLKPGTTIVEATAGNTGIGIALGALNKGYHLIFVIPQKFSQEKQVILRAFGAEIVNTPQEEGMQGARKKADEIRIKIPGAISLNQFENLANPQTHYETTGKEIYDDLQGHIDYYVGGAGTGGTYSGIMHYLKEKNPSIQGILSDPIGSTIGGGCHADYLIEGIGNDFIAPTMDMTMVDQVIKVSDEEAFQATKLLASQEGLFAGSSSGAALSAALVLSQRIDQGNIVILLPDRGERYFSTSLFQ